MLKIQHQHLGRKVQRALREGKAQLVEIVSSTEARDLIQEFMENNAQVHFAEYYRYGSWSSWSASTRSPVRFSDRIMVGENGSIYLDLLGHEPDSSRSPKCIHLPAQVAVIDDQALYVTMLLEKKGRLVLSQQTLYALLKLD